MILPQTAEYALRAMAHISSLEPDCCITASALAKDTGIPVHYLSKIMRRMVNARIISAQKGPGGGFQLIGDASSVNFLEVLKAVDYEPDQLRCAYGWGECDSEHACPLHDSWSSLRVSFMEWAETTTLASLQSGKTSLDDLRKLRGREI